METKIATSIDRTEQIKQSSLSCAIAVCGITRDQSKSNSCHQPPCIAFIPSSASSSSTATTPPLPSVTILPLRNSSQTAECNFPLRLHINPNPTAAIVANSPMNINASSARTSVYLLPLAPSNTGFPKITAIARPPAR